MKWNRGITLIALVITIIVLLILAGVAIAMLSGENGILNKATEAKTKTQNAQKQEETTLSDMEITTDFLANNIKYKIRNGYITGFTIGESVENIEKDLKEMGYEINSKYNIETKKDEPITDKTNTKIATGMKVEKNNQEVARIILFGDINCDGNVNTNDTSVLLSYWENIENQLIQFQIIAGDVNHDGYSEGAVDGKIIKSTSERQNINQDVYAEFKEVKILSSMDIIKGLDIAVENSIVKQETNYKLKLNKNYTYKTLMEKIKEVYPNCSVSYTDDDDNSISNSSEENISTNEWIAMQFTYKVENGIRPAESEIYIQII